MKLKDSRLKLALISGIALSILTLSGCSADENKQQINTNTATQDVVTDTVTNDSEDKAITENDATELDMTAIPSIKEGVQNNLGCFVGCAATGDELDDPEVFRIVTTYFNAITLGNELKPDAMFNYSVDKVPGIVTDELNGEEIEVPKISYARAEKLLDKIYDWNQENPDQKIMVRGHVLVWHSQTPEWFFHEEYDKSKPYVTKDVMNKRLEWYIKTVLTHFTSEDSKYHDMFYGWDVVNEAISDQGGKLRTDAENPNESLNESRHNNNSSWYHVYGNEEFIVNAFKYANKYAPENLELYYNDYNECNIVKMNGIVELLNTIKENEGAPGEGTRISAMGMQGHYGMDDPKFTAVETAIKTYARVVGNVQITEMDISASSDYDGSKTAKEAEYEKQAKRYKMLYFAMKSANMNDDVNVTGLTFWGTVDQYSWLQHRSGVGGGNKNGLPQCPLLFDENYEPKPCYLVFTE